MFNHSVIHVVTHLLYTTHRSTTTCLLDPCLAQITQLHILARVTDAAAPTVEATARKVPHLGP